MKQIEVTILGQSYVLGCPEGGEALFTASVKAVDQRDDNDPHRRQVKARERIAVLAALNLAYRLVQGSDAAPDGEPASPAAVDMDALISRMDKALGEHGQLL